MGQLFSPRANTLMLEAFILVIAVALVGSGAVWAFARTPAATGQYRTYVQPVRFDHSLHVNGLGLDCRYCHAGAERAPMAGLPPTQICTPCHLDSLLRSPLFAPIRTSLNTGRPMAWRRVNTVPDFVFFNHAAHVQQGVDCQTCHGPVQQMPTVYQAAPLTMEWCVGCHREPQRYIKLRESGINGWQKADVSQSRAIAAKYDVARLTSCTTCHR